MTMGPSNPVPAPEAIIAAATGTSEEPWEEHLSAIQQPALLINAPGGYGPPGTPAVLPEENARKTADDLADCRYVKIPGNHMTMLYGENAELMTEAINSFLVEKR